MQQGAGGGEDAPVAAATTTVAGWAVLVGAWVSWMRAGATSEATIRLRRHYVQRLAGETGRLLGHDSADLAAWLGSHRSWSPETRKSARAALRAFYGWAAASGHVDRSPAAALPTVRLPRPVPRPTPEDVYRQALRTATLNRDERALLAIRLAGQAGLRRGEVARVRAEDVERDLLGWSLRVTGKGGHVRLVPLPDDLAEQLQRGEGWVFPSPARPGQPLTAGHVARLVTCYLPPGSTMHQLRHRFATVAYADARDLVAVQELLGHARIETTRTYVAAPREAVRRAAAAAAAAA